MPPLLLVIIFVATVLVLQGLYHLVIERRADQSAVKKRLHEIATGLVADVRLEETILLKDQEGFFEGLWRALPGVDALRLRLYRAGITMSLGRFAALSSGFALIGWSAAAFFFGDAFRAVPFLAVGIVPFVQVGRMANKRMKAFETQFPAGLELLTRALRAGNSLTFAVQMVGDEMPDPVGVEFAQVAHEIKLGKSQRDALENMAYRINVGDLPFFITAVSIQSSTGGNLAEVLENLSHIIRERFKLYGKIRAMTAIGRASANLLAIWPFFMVGMLYIVNPEYISPLWTSDRGPTMILISGILIVVGYFFCLRMAKIEV